MFALKLFIGGPSGLVKVRVRVRVRVRVKVSVRIRVRVGRKLNLHQFGFRSFGGGGVRLASGLGSRLG